MLQTCLSPAFTLRVRRVPSWQIAFILAVAFAVAAAVAVVASGLFLLLLPVTLVGGVAGRFLRLGRAGVLRRDSDVIEGEYVVISDGPCDDKTTRDLIVRDAAHPDATSPEHPTGLYQTHRPIGFDRSTGAEGCSRHGLVSAPVLEVDRLFLPLVDLDKADPGDKTVDGCGSAFRITVWKLRLSPICGEAGLPGADCMVMDTGDAKAAGVPSTHATAITKAASFMELLPTVRSSGIRIARTKG